MKTFKEAYQLVLEQARDYGEENVPLREATGRVLAEDIFADRDFPPFNRSTKDGIALHFQAFENKLETFQIKGLLPAGTPSRNLEDPTLCFEIMTGAVVPEDVNSVVMYEDLEIENGVARLLKPPVAGANIHHKGSDAIAGSLVVKKNVLITAAVAGVLATVGKDSVRVKKLPTVSVISTGNELVEIDQVPLAHQIRKSNSYSLAAALSEEGILPLLLHLEDDKDIIRPKLAYASHEIDVLILSGGVSKGKFDFIPEVLSEIGVVQIFHRVLQRPGKPFWFGFHPRTKTLIFSFPGNPVSTFVCYQAYFKAWLHQSLGLPRSNSTVVLKEDLEAHPDLTSF